MSGLPFRSLLHWWGRARALQLVHAGAVGTADGGALLAGVGGSGKSTTSLVCLEAGFRYAGDDYVAIQSGGPPRVHSLFSTAKADAFTLELLPRLHSLVRNPNDIESEKGLLDLAQRFGGQLCPSLPINALLLPRVIDRADTQVRRASPMEALQALAPTTLFQLPRNERFAFSEISRLVHTVPCYHLELGAQVERIPPVIAELIADPGRR